MESVITRLAKRHSEDSVRTVVIRVANAQLSESEHPPSEAFGEPFPSKNFDHGLGLATRPGYWTYPSKSSMMDFSTDSPKGGHDQSTHWHGVNIPKQ